MRGRWRIPETVRLSAHGEALDSTPFFPDARRPGYTYLHRGIVTCNLCFFRTFLWAEFGFSGKVKVKAPSFFQDWAKRCVPAACIKLNPDSEPHRIYS